MSLLLDSVHIGRHRTVSRPLDQNEYGGVVNNFRGLR